MCAKKIIASEVTNEQVDLSKPWAKEMKQSDIWTTASQNRLALQLKVEAKKGKNIRKVQRGDTLGAIAKALGGALDWSQSVDYRSHKLSAERKPNVLHKANLIYPDQYVWIENGVVIVADDSPDPVKKPTPVTIPKPETKPSIAKPKPMLAPRKKVPKKSAPKLVKPKSKVKPKVSDQKTKPESIDSAPIVAPPIKKPVKKLILKPSKTKPLVPKVEDEDVDPVEKVVEPEEIEGGKPVKPIVRDEFIRDKIKSVDKLSNISLSSSLVTRALGFLEETTIHPNVDFSLGRWPKNRNDFVKKVIAETGDGYFSFFHVNETENRGGLIKPRKRGAIEGAEDVLARIDAPKSRIMGFAYSLLDGSGEALVQSVFDESPAKKAGLRSGDIITRVNNHIPGNILVQEGFVASQDEIFLKVKREGISGLIDISIKPEKLGRLREASTERLGNDVLLVKGPFGFSESLTEDFEKKLEESKRRSIIVDLRNNPGGLISEANQLRRRLKSFHERGFKIALLTNKNSASASEILAADAQIEGWGVVIGERTYGKHVQQSVRSMGSYIMTYTTGLHRRGDKVPVTPDVLTSSTKALSAALKYIQRQSAPSS